MPSVHAARFLGSVARRTVCTGAMNKTITHLALVAVGAGTAALFLGTASAQGMPELPKACPSCVSFDPQPDPPAYPNPARLPSVRDFDPQPDPPALRR